MKATHRYTDNDLLSLEASVKERLSEKRFLHTVSVARCAREIGSLFESVDISELCAAALLHDIAKEIPAEDQIELLNKSFDNLRVSSVEGVLHSFCAPLVIKRDYPLYATANILSATEKHTLGSADMSIFDMIIFISDYAEETRPYRSCRAVRDFLFKDLSALSKAEREKRLIKACIMSIDFTISALKSAEREVDEGIYETRDALLKKM